jgi:hypothetical protein
VGGGQIIVEEVEFVMTKEKDAYWEKMNLLEVMLECGDIIPLEEVRSYQGRLIGKIVEPLPGENEKLKEFPQDDEVVVFHLKDYQKYMLGKDMLLDAYRSITPKRKVY